MITQRGLMSPRSNKRSGLRVVSTLVTNTCVGPCHNTCHSPVPFRLPGAPPMTTSTTRRLHPTGPARSGPTPRPRSNMSPCRPGFVVWRIAGERVEVTRPRPLPPVDESHRMMLSALESLRSAGTATDGPW